MKTPIQLVSGLEAKGSEHLLIISFIDSLSFDGEDENLSTHLCKVALDRTTVEVLKGIIDRFLDEDEDEDKNVKPNK